MVRPHRTLAVALSVTAALGAGAVMSAAQSSPAPTLPGVPPECTTPLPNPAGGQPATFLKVQGLQGESEVDSFRFGASKPGDAGPLAPRTFVIGKAFDKASPQLLTRLANGQHISSVVVTQNKPAGTFLRYTLREVQIVDYEHTGGVARNAERLCLRFNEAEVEFLPQQADGSLGPAVRAVVKR